MQCCALDFSRKTRAVTRFGIFFQDSRIRVESSRLSNFFERTPTKNGPTCSWDLTVDRATCIFRDSRFDSWTFWFRLFKLKVEFEKFDLSDSVSLSFCFSRISLTIFLISKTVGKILDFICWFSSLSKSESELHSDVADSPLSSSSPEENFSFKSHK